MGRRHYQPTPPVADKHGLHGRWPNVGAKLPSMLRVVVVLLQQRNDQLKIELPCMEVRI